tara:strand:- start:3236 stop:3511 length:276 start_codon:yes stop_codon:yes gene_type:complete
MEAYQVANSTDEAILEGVQYHNEAPSEGFPEHPLGNMKSNYKHDLSWITYWVGMANAILNKKGKMEEWSEERKEAFALCISNIPIFTPNHF